MNKRSAACLAMVWCAVQLPACSTQQAYGALQVWQRNECVKLTDAQERRRCMESSSTSFEAYQREAESVKGVR